MNSNHSLLFAPSRFKVLIRSIQWTKWGSHTLAVREQRGGRGVLPFNKITTQENSSKKEGGVLDAVHQENLIINPVKSYFDPESPISSPVPTHQECSTRINHSDHQIGLLWSMCEFKLFFSKFRTSRSQPKPRSKICLRRNYGQPKKSSWCL